MAPFFETALSYFRNTEVTSTEEYMELRNARKEAILLDIATRKRRRACVQKRSKICSNFRRAMNYQRVAVLQATITMCTDRICVEQKAKRQRLCTTDPLDNNNNNTITTTHKQLQQQQQIKTINNNSVCLSIGSVTQTQNCENRVESSSCCWDSPSEFQLAKDVSQITPTPIINNSSNLTTHNFRNNDSNVSDSTLIPHFHQKMSSQNKAILKDSSSINNSHRRVNRKRKMIEKFSLFPDPPLTHESDPNDLFGLDAFFKSISEATYRRG